MVYVYILKLVKNKFYVGKTTNPLFRLNDHYNGNGASWTKKYKPLTLDKIIPNCDEYDEDKYTIKYMDLYGILFFIKKN
jgi:predicted GIY-YIG superfamily endonuclease